MRRSLTTETAAAIAAAESLADAAEFAAGLGFTDSVAKNVARHVRVAFEAQAATEAAIADSQHWVGIWLVAGGSPNPFASEPETAEAAEDEAEAE